MTAALSTMVSLTPELFCEAWQMGSLNPGPDPRHPSTHRLNAVLAHYEQVLPLIPKSTDARLIAAMVALQATEQLTRSRIAIPFDIVVQSWQRMFERFHGQRFRALTLVKDMWLRLFHRDVTHSWRHARDEEKALMKDLLWTMLHRTLCLE